jgi:hypothetical protein
MILRFVFWFYIEPQGSKGLNPSEQKEVGNPFSMLRITNYQHLSAMYLTVFFYFTLHP